MNNITHIGNWIEKKEGTMNTEQEISLIQIAYKESDNYIGYIEICYNKKENKFILSYSIRLNNLKGLPNFIIKREDFETKNIVETFFKYMEVKRNIDKFIV